MSTPGQALLLIWVLTAAGPAAALTCPAPAPPPIQIELTTEPVALDRGKALADLGRLRRPGPQHFTGGLYSATLHQDAEIGFEQASDRIWACVRVSELKLRVGAQGRTINVAREFAAGSCEANAILDHERRHQAADDNLLARAVPG